MRNKRLKTEKAKDLKKYKSGSKEYQKILKFQKLIFSN